MRPRKKFPEGAADELRLLFANTCHAQDRLRVLAVLIRAVVPEATAAQIAFITGFPVTYVAKLHSQFLRFGTSALVNLPGRGGFRHGVPSAKSLARKEELKKLYAKRALIKKYKDEGKGHEFAVTKIKLEEEFGGAVEDAVVYRKMEEGNRVKDAPESSA